MPFTFNGIGTKYVGKKNNVEKEGSCEKCQNFSILSSYETKLFFSILYIPIIPLGKKKVIDECANCSNHKVLPLDEWNNLKDRVAENTQTEFFKSPKNADDIIDAHNNLFSVGHHKKAEVIEDEMLKKFTNNADVLYYLAGVKESLFEYDQAEELFEKALKLNPNNKNMRRAVAINCIKHNNLSRAAKLLAFMQSPGPDQEFQVLYMLADKFQKEGNHSQALFYYRIIIRDFPEIAGSDKYFRKAVKECEKHQTDIPSILPAWKFSNKGHWTYAAAFAIVLIGIVFFFNWTLKSSQKLYIVNKLKVDVSISIPKKQSFIVKANEKSTIYVHEGEYNAIVKIANKEIDNVEIDIENSWWERFSPDKVFILNVGKAAVFIWEETTYSEKPEINNYYSYNLHLGDSFIKIKKADYQFIPFPENISITQNSVKRKSRIGLLDLPPVDLMDTINNSQEKISIPKILNFLEANISQYKKNDLLLNNYLNYSINSNNMLRAFSYLKRKIALRPVMVEVHRNYQFVCNFLGKEKELIEEYDALNKKEPENSDLFYLRGRIEPDSKKAFEYYNRSYKYNNKNPYPIYAKAFYYFSRGEILKARSFCSDAYKLDPDSEKIEDTFYKIRLGLKEYDILEEESRSILKETPYIWLHFTRLLEILILKKDESVNKELQEYSIAIEKVDPQDEYELKKKAQLYLNYLKKEYKSMVTTAKSMKDEEYGDSYLMISHLNLGNMEKVEELEKMDTTSGYNALIYWMGWKRKGEKINAQKWFNHAIKQFSEEKSNDGTIIVKFLTNPGKIKLEAIYNMPFNISSKRILYTTFAHLNPTLRPILLKRALNINLNMEFPYQFLSEEITNLKSGKYKKK